MAVANLTETKLRMIFEAGLDGKGQPIYKAKPLTTLKRRQQPINFFKQRRP